MFNFMTGIDAVQIPYKGSAPGHDGPARGQRAVHVQRAALDAAARARRESCARSGVSSAKRAPQLPEIPPIRDTVPGYEVVTWYSFVAPAGTPKAVVDKLNREISAIVEAPQMKEKLSKDQGIESDAMSPEELGKLYRSETDKWAKVIKEAKITPE
jgi:tripartite-type tricarboxylate transporter receptor subunit TctC